MSGFKGLIYRSAKIGVLGCMLVTVSCTTLKRVGDDALLLTENALYVDGEKVTDSDLRGFIIQKPNKRILGYPLRLQLYNLAKEPAADTLQERTSQTIKRKKQSRGFFLTRAMSRLLRQVGEAPVIVDTALVRKSADRLAAYYNSKGYFNVLASYTLVEDEGKKRGQVVYDLSLQRRYYIDTVLTDIRAPVLDSLYKRSAHRSLIQAGKPFDLEDFTRERERLTTLFKNSGIYNFQESSITYDILRDTTQVADDRGMEVQLNIQKPRGVDDGGAPPTPYQLHRFNAINVYTDYKGNGRSDTLKSVQYEDYTLFYRDTLRYKPQALAAAIFFEKDSVYRDVNRIRTYRQLTNLNTFTYPYIEFVADTAQALLTPNIYLTPRPKYSLNLNVDVTHSNIQQVGTAFGVTAITRNVFGGAETLNLSARAAIGLLSDAYLSDEAFTSELGGTISLIFPRIWFPLNTERVIPSYMLPQTALLVGTNFQRNIGLDKQSLNAVLSYSWSPTNQVRNTIEFLNVEFVRNVNPDNFYNVYQNTYNRLNSIADGFEDNPDFAGFYDENLDLIISQGTDGFIDAVTANGVEVGADTLALVQSIAEREQRLTENNLIMASNYSYTKNSRADINDTDFYQYRVTLESAGNFLSLMRDVLPYDMNEADQLLLFGIPFSQYLKAEVNFIRHWRVGASQVLAFRNFSGLAVPYGNSDNIPFVRSYFAGGSNDNRAWNAYELGPGRTDNLNDFNEANLKLAFNLEYRFPVAGRVKGALFADAGNIWNVFDNEDNPDAIFTGFDSLADIALGTGFGVRYDFTYLVFRADVGFKTYNPAEPLDKRWFREYNFKNAVFNIGINYPF